MRKLFCLILIVGMLALSANAIADDKCDTKEQQAKLETIIQELQQRISENPNDIQAMTTLVKMQNQLSALMVQQSNCIGKQPSNKNADNDFVLIHKSTKPRLKWLYDIEKMIVPLVESTSRVDKFTNAKIESAAWYTNNKISYTYIIAQFTVAERDCEATGTSIVWAVKQNKNNGSLTNLGQQYVYYKWTDKNGKKGVIKAEAEYYEMTEVGKKTVIVLSACEKGVCLESEPETID